MSVAVSAHDAVIAQNTQKNVLMITSHKDEIYHSAVPPYLPLSEKRKSDLSLTINKRANQWFCTYARTPAKLPAKGFVLLWCGCHRLLI